MRRRRTGRPAAVVIAVSIAVALSGCSDDGTDDAAGSTTAPPTTTAECRAGVATEDGAAPTLSEECSRQVIGAMAADSGLSPERTAELSQGLCDYAAQVATLPTPPNQTELLASNAASWEVTVDQAEAVHRAARVLCPEDMASISALPLGERTVTVGFDAEGTGEAEVTYTGPEGDSIVEAVALPWHVEIEVQVAGDVTLGVRGADGATVACAISVGSTRVASGTNGDAVGDGSAACAATPQQVAAALISN